MHNKTNFEIEWKRKNELMIVRLKIWAHVIFFLAETNRSSTYTLINQYNTIEMCNGDCYLCGTSLARHYIRHIY